MLCVSVYICVHGDGRPLTLYSRGRNDTNLRAGRGGDWPRPSSWGFTAALLPGAKAGSF